MKVSVQGRIGKGNLNTNVMTNHWMIYALVPQVTSWGGTCYLQVGGGREDTEVPSFAFDSSV